LRVVVVDDEAPARDRLIDMLGQLEGVEVVGEADSASSALVEIGRREPDLLLLDVAMPGMNGMELAARRDDLPPIVFVTAYERHAVRAFEVDAVDYLLKPVSLERLGAALARARGRPRPAPHARPRVVTLEGDAVRVFDAASIARFWSADKYTLFRAGGQEQVTRESLTSLAERLSSHRFRRVHRGELVRLDAIRSIVHEGGVHRAHLEDGQVVAVSRRMVAALKRELAAHLRGRGQRR